MEMRVEAGAEATEILGFGVSPVLGYCGAVAMYVLFRRGVGRSSNETPSAV